MLPNHRDIHHALVREYPYLDPSWWRGHSLSYCKYFGTLHFAILQHAGHCCEGEEGSCRYALDAWR